MIVSMQGSQPNYVAIAMPKWENVLTKASEIPSSLFWLQQCTFTAVASGSLMAESLESERIWIPETAFHRSLGLTVRRSAHAQPPQAVLLVEAGGQAHPAGQAQASR